MKPESICCARIGGRIGLEGAGLERALGYMTDLGTGGEEPMSAGLGPSLYWDGEGARESVGDRASGPKDVGRFTSRNEFVYAPFCSEKFELDCRLSMLGGGACC